MNLPRFLRALVFGSLTCLSLAAAEPAPDTTTEERVELPKFEVKGRAICSFGVGISVYWNTKTQSISRVYVTDVAAGTSAERANLKAGDEILVINGRKVSEMKGGFKQGSELFDLLVNRPRGEMIDVEVAIRNVKKIILTAVAQ